MRSSYAAAGLLIALMAMAGCSKDSASSGTNPGTGNGTNNNDAPKTSEQAFKVTYEATSDGKVALITYNEPDSLETQRDLKPTMPWTKELAFPKKDSVLLTVAGSPTIDANYETKYPASSCRILVDGKELVKNTSDESGIALCEAMMK